MMRPNQTTTRAIRTEMKVANHEVREYKTINKIVIKSDYKMPTRDVGVATTDDADIQALSRSERWDERQYSFFVDAIANASKDGDVQRLDVLLQSSQRAHPVTHEPYAAYHMALVYACAFAKEDAVSILLGDARVDPSHRQYAALRAACAIDHLQIVLALLDDPRVDPSFDECAVLFSVCELGGHRVMSPLLSHPAVQRSLRVDLLCEHAFRFRNQMAMRAIIQHAKLHHPIRDSTKFGSPTGFVHHQHVKTGVGWLSEM